MPYYETSARRNTNIDEVFIDLVRQIIKADRASGGLLGTTSGGGKSGARRRKRREDAGGTMGGGALDYKCVIL